MERFPYDSPKVRSDAIVAYLLGVAVAFFLQVMLLRVAPNPILTTLIVIGVGGLWYHWRKVV